MRCLAIIPSQGTSENLCNIILCVLNIIVLHVTSAKSSPHNNYVRGGFLVWFNPIQLSDTFSLLYVSVGLKLLHQLGVLQKFLGTSSLKVQFQWGLSCCLLPHNISVQQAQLRWFLLAYLLRNLHCLRWALSPACVLWRRVKLGESSS